MRFKLALVLLLAGGVAAALGIEAAYDEPAAVPDHGELPFEADPPGEPDLEPLVQVSPFGVITKRDTNSEAGTVQRPPGPKVIEVPPHLRGVSSGWYQDAGGYQVAKHQHTQESTPMLLYFRTDWCPGCRAFDQEVKNSQAAAACFRAAVKVIINPDHGAQERKISDRYGVTGYPTLLLVARPFDSPQRLNSSVHKTQQGMRADGTRFNRGCLSALGI